MQGLSTNIFGLGTGILSKI